MSRASGSWRRCSPKERAKSFCDCSSGRRESTKSVKGVPVSAGFEEAGEATGEVLEDGAGDGTASLARDEFVAEFHRVESIVPGVMRAWREKSKFRRSCCTQMESKGSASAHRSRGAWCVGTPDTMPVGDTGHGEPCSSDASAVPGPTSQNEVRVR